jgi:pimeloyl-ACP methyl ester carboxylesterase
MSATTTGEQGMTIVERGSGAPLVFIPGLQGRWEYASVTVDALAEHFRVITFSLCDEPSSGAAYDGARGFDSYGDQVAAVLDALAIRQAMVCGLSFGGLVALNFASRFPDRTTALVLASTPGPKFHLRRRHEVYARLPWIFGPIFLIETPFRARREIKRAVPSAKDRRALAWSMIRIGLRSPLSPSRMAARARLIASWDIEPACAKVAAPTLVLTGEPGLDFVVKTDTSEQYARLIPAASRAVLAETGHQGSITRPREFAEIVRRFAARAERAPDGTRTQDVA